MSLHLPGLEELTEVGRGAYGVVYRARQDRLRRYVAVKVLTTRLDERAAQRFTQECRALGALSGHPNIVTVHEAGTTAAGEPYLVMPFCDRGSLADRTRGGSPLTWPEALDVGIRLAGALQTAHDAGILHRDLKPANVLVDSFANPQLADFGQARHADSELTGTGTVVGTPAYAAPELLRGGPASPESDVHSLAATLVALINGQGPYSRHTGENVAAVMYRALNEPPANLRQRGVPDPVCEVIEWGLRKDPHQRPPSAAVFGKAMQGLQRRLGLPVTTLTAPGEQPAGGPPPPLPPTGPTPTGAPAVGPPLAPPAPPAPTGATPPGTPAGGPPLAPPAGPAPTVSGPSRRTPWLIAAAAVLVVALTATAFFVLRDDDPPPSADPNKLLLSSGDYGIDRLRTSDMNTAFTPLFGEPGNPRETDLAACLGLPVRAIQDWRASAVYTAGTPIGESSNDRQEFAATQSAGLIMDTEANAKTMTTNWSGAKFDTCRNSLLAAGVMLISGQESPVIEQITHDDLTPAAELPAAVAYAGKRIDVPLRQAVVGGGVYGVNHLFVDITIMSAGRSVLLTVAQHFPEPAPAAARTATTSAMSEKLTG